MLFNPSIQEAEAGVSLLVRGQPDLHNKFQNSQGSTEKPCLKKLKQNKTKDTKFCDRTNWHVFCLRAFLSCGIFNNAIVFFLTNQ